MFTEVVNHQWSPTPEEYRGPRHRRGSATLFEQVRTARIAVGDRVLFGQGETMRGKIGRPLRTVAAVTGAQDRHGRRMYVLLFTDDAKSCPIYGAEALTRAQS